MATTVFMPRMGYDMQEARIVQWHKAEGDLVALGEDLAEIETDKAVIPLPSGASGAVLKLLAAEGDTVPVGQLIAVLGAPGEVVPPELLLAAAAPVALAADAPATPTPAAAAPGTAPTTPASAPSAPAADAGPVRASPLARRVAADRGVDLSRVTGTGPGDRVTEGDVAAYADQAAASVSAAPSAGAVAGAATPGAVSVPLSRMRQAIARLTTRSKQEIPHFYLSVEVLADAALDLRTAVNPTLQSSGVRLSINDLLVKSCASALAKHPTLNATFAGDALLLNPSVNIGVVIDMEGEGIIVAALLDCQAKSVLTLSTEGRDLVRRAKSNALRAEELTSSTFCISNLGSLGVHTFGAVVHPPNAAILAVGAIRREPVVQGDAIVPGNVMTLNLSVDHRVEDGVTAARFLAEVKRLMERPAELLPEGLA